MIHLDKQLVKYSSPLYIIFNFLHLFIKAVASKISAAEEHNVASVNIKHGILEITPQGEQNQIGCRGKNMTIEIHRIDFVSKCAQD